MVDFPTKRSATEDKVLGSATGPKPYNQYVHRLPAKSREPRLSLGLASVDDEVTTRLQNVPREIRKSVTEGYRTPNILPRPGDKDVPLWRSHRDDVVWTLDLISPEAVREKELRPLYERLERAGPENGDGKALFSLPSFPGPSGERKRRIERETSPSSSAGNSPVLSPTHAGMELELEALAEDVDMDMDDVPVPLPAPAVVGREIRPRPRRSMKNVQSAPAGGLRFGGGTWPEPGRADLPDVDDEPWKEVDFSSFANKPPE
ncbi:hypothetical protein CALVIDRAFT_595569 [Calocera viscosa TUFC12733]|uniref:Uncharacterized protein n=1 Tax=Calocera viscosa (strain TUFC12733) TaxID=1330018 RepID=A0A167QRF2_CALVF|nr:hypothetical protein CALVIDRAFT_595569 [Calocera viscosa TUFC12733]